MKFTSFLFCSVLLIVQAKLVRTKLIKNVRKFDGGRRPQDLENSITADQGTGNRRMIAEFYHPTVRQKYRNHLKKRADQNPYEENVPKIKSCGIMYRNKEPIGILQPFEESYKLIPVKHQKIDLELNELPLKSGSFESVFPRKTEDNVEEMEEEGGMAQNNPGEESSNAGYSINRRDVPKTKRNAVLANDKSLRSITQSTGEKRSVEDQLKDILNDMGLIEDDSSNTKKQEKRMIKEDENLEEGLNNISMVKEKDDGSRKDNKRSEDGHVSQFPMESPMLNEDDVVPLRKIDDNVETREETCSDSSGSMKRKRHLKSNAGKVNTERKLNFLLDSVRWKARTAMPVVAPRVSQRAKRNDAAKVAEKTNSVDNKNAAINEYEERVQRQIQSKIQALKEEVKREIATLEEEKFEGSTALNEFIRKKRDSSSVSSQEHKRPVVKKSPQKKVNTLLDIENNAVNPVLNVDQELKPYIRRRRQLFKDDSLSTLVKYDVRSPGDITNSTVNATNPAPSVPPPPPPPAAAAGAPQPSTANATGPAPAPAAAPVTPPPTNNMLPANNSAVNSPPKPANSGPIEYSKTFKCNANNTEININFENGLQNIHISMNMTPPPPPQQVANKRQAVETIDNHSDQERSLPSTTVVVIPTGATSTTTQQTVAPSSTIFIDPKLLSNDLFGNNKLGFAIDDSLINQNEIDQLVAPSMKNEVVLNDGLPNYNYKRSCDSGNCGLNKAGESCNCNSAGCSCGGGLRKTRYADEYEEVDDDKRDVKMVNFDMDEEDGVEEESNYDSEENYPSQRGTIRRIIRNGQKSEYYIDMNPDVYHIGPYNKPWAEDNREEDYGNLKNRRKRYDMDEMVALHGGTATRNHLNGVKSRSNSYSRVRRRIDTEPNEDPIQLIDLSDEDIFGALPQSFDGELGRYKRVKR